MCALIENKQAVIQTPSAWLPWHYQETLKQSLEVDAKQDTSELAALDYQKDMIDGFKAKYGLDFTLASDVEGNTVEAYGAWVQKKLYGREYMGIDRSTFLIDGEGRIRKLWRKVKVGGHVAEVLAQAQAL